MSERRRLNQQLRRAVIERIRCVRLMIAADLYSESFTQLRALLNLQLFKRRAEVGRDLTHV